MATQNKPIAQDKDLDKVSVVVGGKVFSDWSGYGIDSDFLIPADAWSMRLGLPSGIFPTEVVRGYGRKKCLYFRYCFCRYGSRRAHPPFFRKNQLCCRFYYKFPLHLQCLQLIMQELKSPVLLFS